MNKDYLIYVCIRFFSFFIGYLPYRIIHFLGKGIGLIAYHCMSEYRKVALSNLACAKDLNLTKKQIIQYAKSSFQNLAIVCLEYAKFDKEKDLSKVIQCKNSEYAHKLYAKGQGIVFFCPHLSNWEVLFLEGNLKMKGVAIGKPIKNKYLYQWVVKIREKTNGVIISPKHALKEGLKALRNGKFMGIVADQGMPESSYSFPFLGRKAFNSTAPALLAYKTNSPIIVATVERKYGKYEITYSDPIWPNLDCPLKKQVCQMMDKSLSVLENHIKKTPGQWLWQHNRWKQQTPHIIYKPYRYDTILVILDQSIDPPCFSILRRIYEKEYLAVILPKNLDPKPYALANEIQSYTNRKELFKEDYRFKVIFNFTQCKQIEKFHLKRSAITAVSFKDFYKLSLLEKENILVQTLCRPNTF